MGKIQHLPVGTIITQAEFEGASSHTGSDGVTLEVTRGYSAIVAASNSPANWIAQADFSCPGVADNVTIQAAIAQVVTAGGGEVKLAPGNFVTTASILMRPQVSLLGSGMYYGAGNICTMINSSAAIGICDPHPDSNGEAAGYWAGNRLKDINIRGVGTASSVGLQACAGSHAQIENIRVTNFDTGIILGPKNDVSGLLIPEVRNISIGEFDSDGIVIRTVGCGSIMDIWIDGKGKDTSTRAFRLGEYSIDGTSLPYEILVLNIALQNADTLWYLDSGSMNVYTSHAEGGNNFMYQTNTCGDKVRFYNAWVSDSVISLGHARTDTDCVNMSASWSYGQLPRYHMADDPNLNASRDRLLGLLGDVRGLWLFDTLEPGTAPADYSRRGNTLAAGGGAVESWDTAPTYYRSKLHYTFNGTDEYFETTGTDFHFDDSAGQGFSIITQLQFTNSATERVIVGKREAAETNMKWSLRLTTDHKLKVTLHDHGANKTCDATTNSALAVGTQYRVGVTYLGTGGATAASGIYIYVNGAAVVVTATNDADYVKMQDNVNYVNIGSIDGVNGNYVGWLALVGVTGTELTADQHWEVAKILNELAGV